jgi:hypothetical protein
VNTACGKSARAERAADGGPHKGDLLRLLRPDTHEPYVFRDRVLTLWCRTLRREVIDAISWTRILALAERLLPQPRLLHPFPDARFAARQPR